MHRFTFDFDCRRWKLGRFAAIAAVLLLAACTPPVSEQEKEIRIAVALTQTAEALAPQDGAVEATDTPEPATATPLPAPTEAPVDTATAPPPPTATTASAATSTPIPAAATVPPAADACTNDVTFVEDLNIPDGTVLSPGQVATKTWRVQNSGTCDWAAEYTWKFVDGTSLSATDALAVTGSVTPQQTYDFSVELTAPADPGRYQGQWRLHDPVGAPFGDAVFYDVTIPGTVTPAAGTPTAGVPTIGYFRSTSELVQSKEQIILSWDVANAFGGVFLRYGGGEEGVTAPGVKTLFPETTTDYELVARNDNGEVAQKITVVVTSTAATPTPNPSMLPTITYFNATATKVKAGDQVILSWDAADAYGGVFLRLADSEKGVVAPGVEAVYPQDTVEYELIARNNNGEARQKIKIEIAKDE